MNNIRDVGRCYLKQTKNRINIYIYWITSRILSNNFFYIILEIDNLKKKVKREMDSRTKGSINKSCISWTVIDSEIFTYDIFL